MATISTSQVGNSYCPQMVLTYSVSTTATQVTITYSLAYKTYGYTFTASSSPNIAVGITLGSGSTNWRYDEYWAVGGKTSQTLFSNHTVSFNRSASDQTVKVRLYWDMEGFTWSGSSIGLQDKTANVTVPHSAGTITNLAASMASDNQFDLSWTRPSTSIDAVYVEVSIDGGSWSQVASLGNASSYSYTQSSADHTYSFRVRAGYQKSVGGYSNVTDPIATSPDAPASISTSAISGSTNVAVELSNPSPVATSLDWQYSTDSQQTWSASQTVAGSPVTSFTATGIQGTAYIRVRNVNDAGASAWLVSDLVTTICPPAAPTLTAPTGNVVSTATGSVTFAWLHNTIDGSPQEAYELGYSTDGGSSWSVVSGGAESTYTMGMPSVGTIVTWRVRTKGADASYSDWSTSRSFSVYAPPTVSITSPSATVDSMPIQMTAVYTDMAGFSCAAATVSLSQNGRTLYSEAGTVSGSSITAQLDVSEFLPTNGESYTVTVAARSSSSLSASANATFAVDFLEPSAGSLQVENDAETGYAVLTVTFDNESDPEAAEAVSVSVARVNPDGTVIQLLSEGGSGSGIVDMYAPLNTSYRYAVTTHAASKAVRTVYVDNVLETDRWFAYWGEGQAASAVWNPENRGIQLRRPQKTRVWYAGRRDPVSYDGAAVELTEAPGWLLLEREEAAPFVRLIEDGGRGVYKSCDGWVYHADFELSLSPEYTALSWYGTVSLSVTRITGGAL